MGIGGCYYAIFIILFVFNIIFNKEKMNCSMKYWVGLFINSLTSILTFNSFSFEYLAERKNRDRSRPPQGTMVKQICYNILFFFINILLTVGTVLQMDNWDDDVEDVNGFSRRSFNIMLVVGWLTFLMSGVLNFVYYKVHPSGVDCSFDDMAKKMTYHVYGSKKVMWMTKKEASAEASDAPAEDKCCKCTSFLQCFKRSNCSSCCARQEEEAVELQQIEGDGISQGQVAINMEDEI